MKIISRAEWGAQPWRTGTYTRPLSSLTRVLIHYHGGPPRATSGVAVPKEIEAIHLANGWSGVGYHFVVSQAGEIFEGRGWDKVGAHCPGHNTDGLGIYIGVGGDQEATPAAKAAARWLYDEACRRTGKNLTKSWHGYDYATECPGPKLIAWVKAGMPTTGATTSTTPTKAPAAVSPLSATWLRKPIAVHGVWSVGTIKRMQAEVNVAIDGIDGKQTWAGIQRWAGATPDGIRGPQTVKAIQRKVGMRQTGRWTPYLRMRLQRHLNELAAARRKATR